MSTMLWYCMEMVESTFGECFVGTSGVLYGYRYYDRFVIKRTGPKVKCTAGMFPLLKLMLWMLEAMIDSIVKFRLC